MAVGNATQVFVDPLICAYAFVRYGYGESHRTEIYLQQMYCVGMIFRPANDFKKNCFYIRQ